MNSYTKIFTFEGYKADIKGGQASFNYSIRDQSQKISFTEKITFPPVQNSDIPKSLLNNLMQNLMLILGVSYWKLYASHKIIIESNFLNKEQAHFWNTVYTKGLGEFFYKNKIDFRGLIQFPSVKQNSEKTISFQRKNRILLGLGGGKDSIVTAELFKAKNKDFDLFIVGASEIQEEVASVIGKKPIIMKRELDSKLFELSKTKGIYNGHIPISAIYAFLGIMAGAFYDYQHFVVGNEKSANYGNVEYLGQTINHQWSKSEEFENLFSEYIKKFMTPNISYSSLLRGMNELEVTKEFVKYPKYFKVFSSCNTNFKILRGVYPERSRRAQRLPWCGKCPKCLFVFICLAAFLPKKEVLDIFGKNFFEDESLLTFFEELIGIRNFKPFECVGTPDEVKETVNKIFEKGEFNHTILMKYFKTL